MIRIRHENVDPVIVDSVYEEYEYKIRNGEGENALQRLLKQMLWRNSQVQLRNWKTMWALQTAWALVCAF